MQEQDKKMKLIYNICLRVSRKFKIPGYEPEDLFQECFILAMDAMNRYDGVSPLENFLSVHLRNRMINFNRDKYLRRRELFDTTNVDFKREDLTVNETGFAEVDATEVFDKIDRELPSEMREDYLRLQDDAKIPAQRKRKLIKVLQEICQEKLENSPAKN